MKSITEWSNTIKIYFACALASGLIFISMSFIVIAENGNTKIVSGIQSSCDISASLTALDNTWVDKESAFQLSCYCIGKPFGLKICTAAGAVIEIPLDSPKARDLMKVSLDSLRYYIKISEENNKTIIFLDMKK